MRVPKLSSFPRFSAALLTVCLAAPAAQGQSITLNTFLPAPTPEDDFKLSQPLDQGHMRLGLQVHGDYANSPLVYEVGSGTNRREAAEVVGHQLNFTVGASLGLFDRLVIFGGLPVVALMRGASDRTLTSLGITESKDSPGLGNAYAGARLRIFGERDDLAALALQATAHIPTAGKDQNYRGEDGFMVHPELAFALRPGPLRIVANLGSRLRKSGGLADLQRKIEATYGLGLGLEVYKPEHDPRRHLDLLVQVYGATEYANFLGRAQTPLELLGGAKFFHESGFIFGASAGPGITRGAGSPDARVVGMLAYLTPADLPKREEDSDDDGLLDSDDDCPLQPEDFDEFEDKDGCPDLDDDKDGIVDTADRCRLDPEDKDEFEDGDGCPDPDNDGDGLLDAKDSCPNDPEDKDEFEDGDGCPDPDNDKDGVSDIEDHCVNEPGVKELDGCPDPDRDGDTVVDRLDNCPDEPGDVDNFGCKKKQKVTLREDHLEINEVVYFQTNRDKIQTRSFDLLLNVASVLNAHTEIPKIFIEGHTDSRGKYKKNVELSRRRAASVKKFLITKGSVDASRLESEGYGPDRPLVPDAKTEDDHAKNRRVEFRFPHAKGAQQ